MKKVMSWLLAFMLFLNAYPSFAQEKRDVKDPVLREIISQMRGKMPKFINKHGETLFVEDEPISRASLLSAFYEYDKSLSESSNASLYVSLQDFNNLVKKVDALSLSRPSSKSESGASASAAKIDIIALIKELDPNMPTLLDKNLKDSKVFMDLQRQISSWPELPQNILNMEKDLQDANARIDALYKNFDSFKTGGGAAYSSVGADNSYVDREISDVNKRIEALSKKVDSAKSSAPSARADNSYVDREISDVNKRIEALSRKLDLVKSALPSSGADNSYVDREISDVNKRIDALSKKLDLVKSAPSSASSSPAPSGVSAAYVDSEIADLNRKIEGLSKQIYSQKPVMPVDQSLQKDINQASRRIDELTDKINSVSKNAASSSSLREFEEIKQSLRQIQQNYASLSKRVDDLSSSVKKEDPEITVISRDIENIKKTIASAPTVSDVQKEISKTKSETQSDVEKKITDAHREIIKTRSQAQSDIGRIEKKLNAVSSLRERGRADSASASTIATISLGLAMVAGLLAAR